MSSQQSILTKAELAFIRQIVQSAPIEASPERLQLVEISEQLNKLLSHYAAEDNMTIHAQLGNQDLTFDLHIHQDEQNVPSLQLSAPQIYDHGDINRPWRTKLDAPIPLRRKNLSATGLWINQLSMNSILVECHTKRAAPKRFQSFLQVDNHPLIAVAGELVRKTNDGSLAYWMHACDPVSDEHLRQFIYEQHLLKNKPA
jgi:hypothetical protein